MQPQEDSTKYLKVLVWPGAFVIVAVVALWLYRDSGGVPNLSLSSSGIELSWNLLQAERLRGAPGDSATVAIDEDAIVEVAQRAQSISLRDKDVLWVDDNPSNNEYERGALEALGVQFTLAESTTEALRLVDQQHFDSIISDFGRRDDSQAAYTLLVALEARGNSTPFIIYSTGVSPEQEAEAQRRGALAETDRPLRLFELVVQSLQSE